MLARSRAAGFAGAFDHVLEDIERRGQVPTALTRIVGIERERPAGEEGAPAVANVVAGEPVDLLLSKPANAEQIDIARALARHDAVLVQGPPGTGKTHTIANLIGHLVAQGKRVLVTSHATKALRMVREHLVEELRPLSVAVLDTDVDGRLQMEQAVHGIAHRLSTSTEERLAAEVASLVAERDGHIAEIVRMSAELRAARENEYLPIKLGAEEVAPAEAARFVGQNANRLGGLPGPLAPDAPLPLSEVEVRELLREQHPGRHRRGARADPHAAHRRPAPLARAAGGGIWPAQGPPPAPTRIASGRPSPTWATPSALAGVARALSELGRDLGGLVSWQRLLVIAGHARGAEEGALA